MFELVRLRSDHATQILAFELTNRAFFSRSINDRGAEYFQEFPDRHRELLIDQDAGLGAYFVLVDENDTVLGRFNLYDIKDGSAHLGYRVAERCAGRGTATAGVRDLCLIAKNELRLRTLRAVTGNDNVASQRVLEKSGFVVVGPTRVVDRDGVLYELDLSGL